MVIKTKKNEKLTFNNIERKEFEPLNKYLTEKKIKSKTMNDGMEVDEDNIVITSKKDRKAPNVEVELPSDDESFEDYNSAEGEEEESSSYQESEKSRKQKKKAK